MPGVPSLLFQFWQELKGRKAVGIITLKTAPAYKVNAKLIQVFYSA